MSTTWQEVAYEFGWMPLDLCFNHAKSLAEEILKLRSQLEAITNLLGRTFNTPEELKNYVRDRLKTMTCDVSDCNDLKEELAQVMKELDIASGLAKMNLSNLQEARASNAALIGALEKILLYTNESSRGQTQILIWAKDALSQTPDKDLSVIREAIKFLEQAQCYCFELVGTCHGCLALAALKARFGGHNE